MAIFYKIKSTPAAHTHLRVKSKGVQQSFDELLTLMTQRASLSRYFAITLLNYMTLCVRIGKIDWLGMPSNG